MELASKASHRNSRSGSPYMSRPHQGLAAFGLEKVDLLRVNGNAPPVLQVQRDAVFEDDHESSLRLPVVSAVKRGPGGICARVPL